METSSELLFQEIIKLAPVSQWSFARVTRNGAMSHIFVSGAPEDLRWHRHLLRAEHARLREQQPPGGLVDTAASLLPYKFGLTACFTSGQAMHGLLVLVRGKELGPFGVEERRRIASALANASRNLPEEAQLGEGSGAFVVDREMRVEAAGPQSFEDDGPLAVLLQPVEGFLAPALASAVSSLVEKAEHASGENAAGMAVASVALEVRVTQSTESDGRTLHVHVEQQPEVDELAVAARRFGLSGREVDVLELLLTGSTIGELADRLDIAETTVRDHVKRLLIKTGSRNRVEVAAKALGFRSQRFGRPDDDEGCTDQACVCRSS